MYTDIHTDFILEPIYTILIKGINACNSLPFGIGSYPMSEYYLQSVFINMTGALEQKMKCICWQIATDDYQYRYEFLRSKNYGECSSYTDKNNVYKDLIDAIKRKKRTFSLKAIWNDYDIPKKKMNSERETWQEDEKKKRLNKINNILKSEKNKGKILSLEEKEKMRAGILNKPYSESKFLRHIEESKGTWAFRDRLKEIHITLAQSIFAKWRVRDYLNFQNNYINDFQSINVAPSETELLKGSLVDMYEQVVYKQRNRIAHNTLSYQQNLPDLSDLADKNYYKHNYFYRFVMLVVLDDVFIRLYKKYIQ